MLSLIFTVENYGIKLEIYEIDSAHSDMCSSKIMITHFVYCMKNDSYIRDLLESTFDYRKINLLVHLIKIARGLLHESGFVKRDIDYLCLEFKNILLDHNEEYLDYFKNEEEAVIEKVLGK